MGKPAFTIEGSSCVEVEVTSKDIINQTRDIENASKIVIGLIEKFPEVIRRIYGYLKPSENDLKIFPKPKKIRAEVIEKFKGENKPLSQFL